MLMCSQEHGGYKNLGENLEGRNEGRKEEGKERRKEVHVISVDWFC